MDSSSIELPGSEIETILWDGETLRVRFARAYIVKTMTGSAERTRWWQKGELVIGGAEVEGELPQGPLVLEGGDLVENVYTYRDMIPLPLESRGTIRCNFRFRGTDTRLLAQGERVRLEMEATPKYIEHIRPGVS